METNQQTSCYNCSKPLSQTVTFAVDALYKLSVNLAIHY